MNSAAQTPGHRMPKCRNATRESVRHAESGHANTHVTCSERENAATAWLSPTGWKKSVIRRFLGRAGTNEPSAAGL
jgi:ribosomal protein S11